MKILTIMTNLFICLFLIIPAYSKTIKVTSWNMDWLTLHPENQDLPYDIPQRHKKDFEDLKNIIQTLSSDILALQEIDDQEALTAITPQDYKSFITHDKSHQHTAFIIHKNMPILAIYELSDFAISSPLLLHPLRNGLAIDILFNQQRLTILNIHFKTGCWARLLNERKHACPILYKQFKKLKEWILQKNKNHEHYIILGDFNRRLMISDPLWQELTSHLSSKLNLTTSGYANPCQGGNFFIDHIILDEETAQHFYKNSLRVKIFNDHTETLLPSDHCPVSIDLTSPSKN